MLRSGAEIRCYAERVSALRRFAAAVQRPGGAIALDEAALMIGAWDVEVDVAGGQRALDDLASRAAAVRDQLGDAPWAGARAVARILFDDVGFRGNTDDYYDPKNSFLHEVLARRTGIPITLSVLYMEVARRIGVAAAGIGLPGHFLVRVDEAPRALIVDPFHAAAELDHAAIEGLLHRVLGPEAQLEPEMLAPVATPRILMRVLANLAGIYGQRGDWFRSLEVLERLALLDPDNPRIAHELAQLRTRVADLN
jgi:regulator of sirC expression with transglutaminase-like and TPR domain